MGRKKTPAEISAQRGDPGRRGADKVAARAEKTISKLTAEPPFPLADTFSKKMWRHLTETLKPLGFVRKSDELVLAMLCDTLAEYRRCGLDIKAAGGMTYEAETYVNAKGEETDEEMSAKSRSRLIRAHPAVMIRRRARNDIVSLCEKLGLTPGMRYSLIQQSAANIERPSGIGGSSNDAPSAPSNETPSAPHLFN